MVPPAGVTVFAIAREPSVGVVPNGRMLPRGLLRPEEPGIGCEGAVFLSADCPLLVSSLADIATFGEWWMAGFQRYLKAREVGLLM